MELTLNRTYYSKAVVGQIFKGSKPICHTVELPFSSDDEESCIPEGRYQLKPRFTDEEGWHLEINPVWKRPRVIIHDMEKADRYPGSIIPFGEMNGDFEQVSRTANIKLKKMVFDAHENREQVFLTIRMNPN